MSNSFVPFGEPTGKISKIQTDRGLILSTRKSMERPVADRLGPLGVNFINVKRTNCFMNVVLAALLHTCNQRKAAKQRLYEKFVCLTLMKLTTDHNHKPSRKVEADFVKTKRLQDFRSEEGKLSCHSRFDQTIL